MRYWCDEIELLGRKCHVARLGKGRHGAVGLYLVCPDPIVSTSEDEMCRKSFFIDFPLLGWRLAQGPRGWLLLSRDEESVTGIYEVSAGYRGTGRIEVLEPTLEHVYRYPLYRSQVGSLGIGEGIIFSAPTGAEVVLKWERTGRLYGDPPFGLVGILDGVERWAVSGIASLDELAALRCSV